MGASNFSNTAEGSSAKEAFKNATEEARYKHGHGGYTGTIAEKSTFTMISVPAGEDPHKYADRLMDEQDRRVDDKWGPAGCIDLGGGKYLFFGVASS